MSQVLIIKGEFLEGGDFKILARVTNHNRTVLTTADLPSSGTMTVNLYDLSGSSPQTAIATSGAIPSNVPITNNLLGSNDGWTQDSIGANFLFVVCSTASVPTNYAGRGIVFPTGHPIGGHRYRVEALITTAQFGVVPVVAEALCRPVYSA